jgi:photosystem II stability/assembly factor-like uncharacterized protein
MLKKEKTKTLIRLFAISIGLISINCYGQWTELTSGTLNYLYDVHFPVIDTGYVVGGYGTILKTTNGGTSWTSINIGVTHDIRTAHFFDSKTGIIAGDSSVFMKTTDGGLNWTYHTVPLPVGATGTVINDIHFPTPNVGYAGAKLLPSGGVIFKTTNGGDSWDTLSTNFYALRTIFCLASDTCFTMGYDPGFTDLYKTTDGNNWIVVDSLTGQDFECIFFTNSNTGYITGWYSTATYKTIDGGNTWSTLIPGASYDLYDLYFPSFDTGYGVGWSGNIVKTTNEGVNWTKQPVPDSTITFYSVYFTDNIIGYAVGTNGTILKTANGGETGINETPGYGNYKIYPNPFDNSATLTFDNSKKKNHTLTLYDKQGRLVRTITDITTDRVIIKKDNLTSGQYFFQLRNNRVVRANGKLTID